MNALPSDQIEPVLQLLAAQDISEDAMEREIAGLVGDPALARRAIDWIPEVFGLVFVGHMKMELQLPTTFQAKDRRGVWHSFPFSAEPIFAQALRIATEMYHNGPREIFRPIVLRSSSLAVVNNALNAGATLTGVPLSGPALIGIPAETYGARRRWWHRLFRGAA